MYINKVKLKLYNKEIYKFAIDSKSIISVLSQKKQYVSYENIVTMFPQNKLLDTINYTHRTGDGVFETLQSNQPIKSASIRFYKAKILVSSQFHLNIGKHLSFRDNVNLLRAIQAIVIYINKLGDPVALPEDQRIIKLFPSIHENSYLQSWIFEKALGPQTLFAQHLKHISDDPLFPRVWDNISLVNALSPQHLDIIAKQTQSIMSVNFKLQNITKELIQSLAKLSNITKLCFCNQNIKKPSCNDALIEQISIHFPKLKVLKLPNETAIYGNTLNMLPETLQKLQLLCGKIPYKQLRTLMRLQSLKSLDLTFYPPHIILDCEASAEQNKSSRDQTFPPLQLQSFKFSGIRPMNVLSKCGLQINPQYLQKLQIIKAPLDEFFCSFLLQSNTLQQLKISSKNIGKMQNLIFPTSIEMLDLSGSTITKDILHQLSSLSLLRKINLRGCSITAFIPDWLAHLPNKLQSLDIKYSPQLLSNNFYLNLEKLTHLTELNISDHQENPLSLSSLPKRLQSLALCYHTFSPASFEIFKNLPHLLKLNLCGSKMEEKNLELLPEYLEELHFNRSVLWTENALRYMDYFYKLKELVISLEGNVSIATVRCLPTTLQSLTITADRFSEDALHYIHSLSNLKRNCCYVRMPIVEKFGFDTKHW